MAIHRHCDECGVAFVAKAHHGDFCSTECRKAFNNRRALRGAELYDLFMCLRHDRPIAKALHAWRLICRMAAQFRAEDRAEREGRKSWRPARKVIERHPYLLAIVMSSKTWRKAG